MQQSQTVRIDVERLDHLMNTVGELVIDKTRITQISRALEAKYKDDEWIEALSMISGHVTKVVNEIQESMMQVRMLPIGTVFSGLPRMVRDLARQANRKLDFTIEGQETEIDRTVTERIRDPILHLLRNAVDHGVESPEEREAAGKPAMATIRLSALHEQGHIVISVEDDGRGIDPQRLKDSAVRKGLVTEEMASRLSDLDALDLIFIPGSSTAEKTSDVSGRGVGMDIVKTNIESINGFVSVETKLGVGTKFVLKLPLTLATIEALMCTLGRTVYAVPLVHVAEVVRLEKSDTHTVSGKEVMRLREDLCPLIRLGKVFCTENGKSDSSDATFVVVVRYGERSAGLVVDSLMEAQEIVVKPLGEYMGDARCIAGASILGDGQVGLIMDIPSIISSAAAGEL